MRSRRFVGLALLFAWGPRTKTKTTTPSSDDAVTTTATPTPITTEDPSGMRRPDSSEYSMFSIARIE